LGGELFGLQSEEFANLAYNYGKNLLVLGRHEQALPILDQALAVSEAAHGAESPELVPVLLAVGHASEGRDNRSKRKRVYSRAFDIRESQGLADSAEHGWFLVSAGVDMMNLGREAAGERHLKRGYAILLETLGPEHVRTGYAAYHLGTLELSSEHYADARDYLLGALNSFVEPDRPSNAFELGAHAHLVRVFEALGERDQATRHCLAIGRMTPFESTQEYFPILKQAPQFPMSALRSGKAGFTVVEYDVNEQGIVVNPRVVRNEGHEDFKAASLAAAREFRYAPRFVDGEPVPVQGVQNKFTYEINY
jgi:TonB family protein